MHAAPKKIHPAIAVFTPYRRFRHMPVSVFPLICGYLEKDIPLRKK